MVDFWKGKNVLVTGGSGFVGSFVVEQLVNAGSNVTIITQSKNDAVLNLSSLLNRITIFEGDLMDASFVEASFVHQEIVFHLASYKRNIVFHQKYPADILRINTTLAMNVLEAAKKNNIERLLLMSSGIVYGNESQSPNKEEDGLLGEVETAHFGYGWSKRFTEVLARAYVLQTGMKIAIARPYNVFGPRDNFDKESAQVVPAFINRILDCENPFVMWGDGNQERSFLYVEDLARGLLDLTERYAVCDPVNFGTNEVITLKELALLLMDIEGINPELQFDMSKPNGLVKRNCDNSKSFEKIGFQPQYSLKEGLKKTIEWRRSNT